MVGKTKAITKEDKLRFELLPQVGCICCKAYGIHNEWIQIHHLIDGNKRMGHQYTLPLCYFHHEGVPPEGMSYERAVELVGPPLKDGRFRQIFGSELELLEYTNKILTVIKESII